MSKSTSPGTGASDPYAVVLKAPQTYSRKQSTRHIRMAVSQLADIPEQERWFEVAFNVCLLERFDLAREDVLELEIRVVVFHERATNQFKGEERGLRTGTHSCDAHPTSFEVLSNGLDVRDTRDQVREDGGNIMNGRKVRRVRRSVARRGDGLHLFDFGVRRLVCAALDLLSFWF